jgi:hypothetical protein
MTDDAFVSVGGHDICEVRACGHIIAMDSGQGVFRLAMAFALRLFSIFCLSPGVRVWLRALLCAFMTCISSDVRIFRRA